MPARVLIIENDPAVQKLLAFLLRTRGHEVLTADTGEDGLKIARQEDVDLILCDIRMSGIDGFEVARRLHRDASWRIVPMIAATGLVRADDRETALAAGFSAIISKGIPPKQLIDQIQSFLPNEVAKSADTEWLTKQT